ncbi:MAG: molybdopterin-guanine dinucleotide biosynthesis protein B [Gammaproteobacteria bacterium]|nr:molybdopterin-guanine dinucleotide biosynthesis protein B [Gammaproteobacteria bacterium]
MTIEHLPVLGVCGFSGSGKTTLLQAVIPELVQQGLRIAVVKHDVHGIQVDHPGKDSDVLFHCGADILLQGPGEHFFRIHAPTSFELIPELIKLSRQYDLVLVEGHKDSPIPKVWLLNEDEQEVPVDKKNIIGTLARNSQRPKHFFDLIRHWLTKQWAKAPVYGCVLIGGQSSRMGRPKHLIESDGKNWLTHSVNTLSEHTEQVIIAGAGEMPKELKKHHQLPDAPNIVGPLAGILSAMRWAPHASWLISACDMPCTTRAALRWLLSSRAPGVWGVLPKLSVESYPEPLLAYYDFRAAQLLEKLSMSEKPAPNRLSKHEKIISPITPKTLSNAWRNINTEQELDTFKSLPIKIQQK